MDTKLTKTADWRYCQCGHQPDDHNPIHFGCFLCSCKQWKVDREQSVREGVVRLEAESKLGDLRN